MDFTDNTTMVISNSNVTSYIEEVEQPTVWYKNNKLSLNVYKIKEFAVDLRTFLCINGSTVERIEHPGIHIMKNLTWTTNSLAKRAHQCLHFLQCQNVNIPLPILNIFYSSTTDSILTSCITVWLGICNILQRIGSYR